jgi:cytochrome c biogenesis protein CcmG/thiol:disulfide interchange protein DsbE
MRLPRPILVGLVGVVALAAAVVAWFSLLQAPSTEGPAAVARPGAPAPQIALPLLGGGTSSLASERGKVVLVNFWATWCEPCKTEMPGLQQLVNDLHDQPFVMYSVDLQEDSTTIEAFLQQYDLRLQQVVLDEDGNVTRAYGVRGLPATFLIDRQGVLRQQRLGPLVAGGAETAWSGAWVAAQVRALLS